MKQYFEKYALQNTELSDFMECFQKAADMKNVQIDLMSWMQSWLMTSGINTLTPVVQKTENGKYSISIKQDKA
jgi:aminopeptidase N